MKTISLSLLFTLLSSAVFSQSENDISNLLERMMKSINEVKTARYKLIKTERYDGSIVKSEQLIKQSINPMKVYVQIIKGPNSGSEILFIQSSNNNKAIVNVGASIPRMSVSPNSPLVRNQQRHTLYELGFQFTGDLIYDAYLRFKNKAVAYTTFEGVVQFDNKECYKITLDNKEYKLKDYTVKAGEDLLKIAHRLKLDEYSLLEYNPSVKDYDQVKPGQVIKIPDTFCKTVTMYIDKKNLLPVYQKIEDEKGFVGEYAFYNLEINTPIPDEEFLKNFGNGQAQDIEEVMGDIVEEMMVNIRKVKTATFRLIKNERYDGKMIKSEQSIKLNVNPKKVYLKILKGPNNGTELLFVYGSNKNNALISAGSWLPNVSLSPFSSLVRDKQRHTLYELGFTYTGDLIYDAYIKYKHKAEEYSKYEGIIDFDGRKCHKIILDNKDYQLKNYKVEAGENIISIARKFKLDEYSLLEYNPSVKNYVDVKPGQVIKIPDTFAKKVVMYVDVKYLLPVYQKVYDLKGLVAEYEYRDLKINIPIADEEFSKDYKDYDF